MFGYTVILVILVRSLLFVGEAELFLLIRLSNNLSNMLAVTIPCAMAKGSLFLVNGFNGSFVFWITAPTFGSSRLKPCVVCLFLFIFYVCLKFVYGELSAFCITLIYFYSRECCSIVLSATDFLV